MKKECDYKRILKNGSLQFSNHFYKELNYYVQLQEEMEFSGEAFLEEVPGVITYTVLKGIQKNLKSMK